MENDLIEIINGLMCSDTEKIRSSTAALMNAYKTPESLPCLVHIAKTNTEKNIRHYAVVLLNKRLCKLRHWLAVPVEHKATIMRDITQALITEEEKCVENALAKCVTILVKHETDKAETWMAELINHTFERCSSADPKESERGSSIFETLAAAAPDQFSVHMETICTLFSNILLAAEAQDDLATPTVANMIKGTSYCLRVMAGNSATEQMIIQDLPLVIKALEEMAMKGDTDRFTEVLNMLLEITDYFPHLTNNLRLLLDFCLSIGSNIEMEEPVRVGVIGLLACIVSVNKAIADQNLVERILSVVFEIFSTNYVFVVNESDHILNEDSNGLLTVACQALTLLSMNMPQEMLISTLLQLQMPARGNPDPIRRAAILLGLALIAERCSETLRHKFLKDMMDELNRGIADSAEKVQGYAFLALCKFSMHLQPQICEFAPVIVPLLFENLLKLVDDLQEDSADPVCCNWLFTAMDAFWENLEENITPYLPALMECVFNMLDPRFTIQTWELSLSIVPGVSKAAKEHLVPYLQKIIEVLNPFLVKNLPVEMASLQLQAIDALASIIRFIPKEHVLPLANETKIYCLMMVEEGPSDPDFRRVIFRLIGALSSVMNESMAEVFPQVMTLIIQTVYFAEEVALSLREQIEQELIENASGADEDSDRESSHKKVVDTYYQQISTYHLVEKNEAILALRDFAVNTGAAFIPYLQPAFEKVYMMLDHEDHQTRTLSSETLCEFVCALNRSGDTVGVTRSCEILLPKLAEMMRNDRIKTVLICLLNDVGKLFRINGQLAMPSQECAELIYACIRDTFLHKMSCQLRDRNGEDDEDNEEEESERDNEVVERAGHLVSSFGCALDPQTFSLYSGQLFCFLIQRLDKAKNNDKPEHRAFIYKTLAESFRSLGICSATYFDTFCPLFLEGTKDTDSKSRQNAFYALGKLVIYSGEKSFESYPTILQTLFDAIAAETAPGVMDNICGALARLIMSNIQGVSLATVLPVLMSHLPLRQNFTEYLAVLETFHLLCIQAAPSTADQIEGMLYVVLSAVHQEQITDQDTKVYAKEFINLVYTNYPDKFNNLSPEILQSVQTL